MNAGAYFIYGGRKMIYRITLTLGYRDCYIDFDNAEEAAQFAETIVEHAVKPEDERHVLSMVTINVINAKAYAKEEEEEE